jgi:two-component system, cell cycle sensor histidine kinase and response regulator CckA
MTSPGDGKQNDQVERGDGVHTLTSSPPDPSGITIGESLVIQAVEPLREYLSMMLPLGNLGIMACSVLHDVNNRLMAILVNAELLRLEMDSAGETAEVVQKIKQSAQEAAALNRLVLDFRNGRIRCAEIVSIRTLVEEIAAGLRLTKDETFSLVLEHGETAEVMLQSRSEIQLAVRNLVRNAIDALQGKGGEVALRTGVTVWDHSSEPEHWYGLPLVARRCAFAEVEDTGCGMDQATLSQAFLPLNATNPRRSGVGLSVVLSSVRANGGAIVVSTRPGSGARLRMLFPCHESTDCQDLHYPG